MNNIDIYSKKALLLDMNGTFMFGEDRSGKEEDFSIYYHAIGGTLTDSLINQLIREIYNYLDERYLKEEFRHCFPSIERCSSQCISRSAT